MCTSLYGNDDDEVDDRALLEHLEQHIFATFRLKLDAMRLTRIATFVLSVGTDGRLKASAARFFRTAVLRAHRS